MSNDSSTDTDSDEDNTEDHNILINGADRDYKAGDILYRDTTQFKLANHYAVYIGGNNVIDLTKENGIQRRSLNEFANDCEVNIRR